MDIRARPCMCALAAAGVVMLSEANERHDAHSASPELYAPNVISTADNELNSAFTPDGRTLYFTRKAGADGKLGVILVSRLMRDGHWGTPEVASF